MRREHTPLPCSVNLHDVTQVFHDCLCEVPISLAIRGECVYRGQLCPPRTAVLCLQETVATKLTSRSWCREGCVCSGLFWKCRHDEESEMWGGKNGALLWCPSQLRVIYLPHPTLSYAPPQQKP